MKWTILIAIVFSLGCGDGGSDGDNDGGGGSESVNINLNCSENSTPLNREGCNVVINQTNPSEQSSVGEVVNEQLTLEEAFLNQVDPDGVLTIFEEECAKCCDPLTRPELSEGSCVERVEARFNDDCSEEVLVDFAGCSADLSG